MSLFSKKELHSNGNFLASVSKRGDTVGMKVLHVTNSLTTSMQSGGVEVVVRNANAALTNAGIESTVCAMTLKSDSLPEMNFHNFQLFPTSRLIPTQSWSRFSILAFIKVLKHIKKADIVHIHLCKDFFTVASLLICKVLKKPFLVQMHGMIAPKTRLAGKLSNFLLKIFVASGPILCLTRKEVLQLERLGFSGRKLLIPNPIPIGECKPYKVAERTNDVLFLSRFHPRKRPKFVVEASRILATAVKNIQVVMAGPDDGILQETVDLVNFYGLNEMIFFPGSIPRSQIEEMFKSSKVFVLPSYGEIYPMAALEAASTSTPMILGPDCPLAEELTMLEAALLADSPEELAMQIEKILLDLNLANRLVRNAYQWLKKNCSYEVYSSILVPIYESALNVE